jgi:hypothetical protein
VAEEHWLALLFSWGGLLFDLAIVPLLLWRPTRVAAFCAAVVFHLMNAFMFDIGVFPWLMIGATTVFFDPDWPRRLITSPPSPQPTAPGKSNLPVPSRRQSALITTLIFSYILVQLVLPFRFWLYPGNVLWTEQGTMFTWHMMLADKDTGIRFMVTDRATGRAAPADLMRWLNRQQLDRMGYDPEMMREFAHFLRRQFESQGKDVEVRVLALCSLNGRKPQLLVDPTVDLSRQPRTWPHQPYIVPLREPFRWQPWNVPVPEWEKYLREQRKD